MNDEWVLHLRKLFGDRILVDVSLARFTTFKVGGPADIFFEAKNSDELIEILSCCHAHHIPRVVLGGGTNVLIGDKGIRGLVIKNATRTIRIAGVSGTKKMGSTSAIGYIEADSGVLLNSLVRYSVEEGLAGLEMHLGLPGTVGGALYMNSKWTKPVGYVGDVVHSALIMTPQNQKKIVDASYFDFKYDYSTLQKSGDIVISVTFALQKKNTQELWKIANESIEHRRITQPQGVKSAGCIFKNITREQSYVHNTPNATQSAGYLIDSVGLKGFSIGGAMISPMHANFIVNNQNATAADVLQLIHRAKEQVKNAYGIELEEEVIMVGEFE